MIERPLTRTLRGLSVLAVLAVGTTTSSCVPRNDDINLVQPGFVSKALFADDDEWYYRRTIVKSETTNSYAIEGLGDWTVERIKFEIQEDVLIAYKADESLPGAGTQTFEGNTFYKGPVVAAWPIESHFDIQRGYDELTNRVTNVIDENTVDRAWYDRRHMRVDFATNLIEDNTLYADYALTWFPIRMLSTGSYWTNLDTRPTDPFASRFSDDYIEVTDNVLLGSDVFTCAAFVGFSAAGVGNCGFGEAKVRHSFLRITEESDFQPRPYPDAVIRKDENDQTIYDPETGEVVRENIYGRFGVFRLQIPTYDRGYGYTESGRLFRARLYDLWERSTDAETGEVLPYAQRTPKPIVWYLNAEYPMRWLAAAQKTGAEYNRVFSSMVANLMGTTTDQIPDMFEVRINDCNEQNVIDFVSDDPDLFFAVERAVCAAGEACSVTLQTMGEHIGVGNLKTVCTSLEAATRDPQTGASRFTWQRIGDLRHSMIVFFSNPQESGWGGLGPSNADARTGEVISGTAYVRGHVYEVGAATVNDYVALINDEQSVTDVIYGQQIRQHVATTLERRRRELQTGSASGLADMLGQRISLLGAERDDKLVVARNPDHLKDRMERVKGTRLEERLVTQLDLAIAGYGKWRPGEPVTDELWDRAAPWGRATEQSPLSSVAQRARAALGEAGLCFLNADFDPHWGGLAYNLRDVDPAERYEIIADRLLTHVLLHEVGHNVGLAHNFEGSFDALNYDITYWNNSCVDGVDVPDCSAPSAVAAYDQRRVEAQVDELRHTTVMEYMSSKGLFADFLGQYDEAAIRFAYAEQVQVFDSSAVQVSGGDRLRQWRYLNDYRELPNHLCGGQCADPQQARDVISRRSWVTFDPQNPPANEVPYLFCDNAFNRMTPFCATFDFGASLTEVFMNYKSMWQDYFFFNNFIRDRVVPIAWDPSRAATPLTLTLDFGDLVAQYFYIMTVNAQSDPNDPFASSYLRQDMASVLGRTLNFATEVMSTPEPGRMCVWTGSPARYLPSSLLGDCDEYVPLDSAYAAQRGMIEAPLGDARPGSIGFTEDYEDFDWSFVGSFFDKDLLLLGLGFTQPRLFRFNYDLDQRNFYISQYRLFEPELRSFYGRIMDLDNFFIVGQTADELGSYWCRSPSAPGAAYLGYFEPRRMIDLDTLEAMPGPSADCQQPAVLYPTIFANIPFNAMFYAHSLFSSDLDAQVDMGKELKIFVRGADDDFEDWAALSSCESAAADESCFCSMLDSLTGIEYRGVQDSPTADTMACRLIASAAEAQLEYEGSNFNPDFKDYWRGRVERLEYARDLYRMYHNR